MMHANFSITEYLFVNVSTCVCLRSSVKITFFFFSQHVGGLHSYNLQLFNSILPCKIYGSFFKYRIEYLYLNFCSIWNWFESFDVVSNSLCSPSLKQRLA